MTLGRAMRRAARWALLVSALPLAGYGLYVGWAWLRYGNIAMASADEADPLVDRIMPTYDVVERHSIRIEAPADVVLATAREMDLGRSFVARTIFQTRDLVLGAAPDRVVRPKGLVPLTQSGGWGVRAEIPGREIVMGAVTQPWFANVVFQPVPPAEFAAFHAPVFVKIVWTLRADPVGFTASVFRTETRVATTDAEARRRFRWYWARFSPGIVLIRQLMLAPLKADAEQRARALRTTASASDQGFSDRQRASPAPPRSTRTVRAR